MRHRKLLLGSRQRRLGRVLTSLRSAIFGGGVVEFLLGDQSRLGLVGADQPHGVGVQGDVIGLGAQYLALRLMDLFFRMVHFSLCLVHLGHQFRNFQHRQHLSGVNPITNIDVDVLYITGYLGVQLDILVGTELPGDGQRVGNRLPLDRSDRGIRNAVSLSSPRLLWTILHEPASPLCQRPGHSQQRPLARANCRR